MIRFDNLSQNANTISKNQEAYMNIALTGGGTAGHVMPNMALLKELRKKFDKIIYIGNQDKIEYDICKKYDVQFFHCDSIKFDRTKVLSNIAIPFKLPSYINQAKELLKQNNIDIVFSKGGYVALPVVYAAKKLNIPTICHESDYTMGLANKLTSKFAKGIITCFESTSNKKNVKVFPNPIRDSFFEGNAQNVFDKLPLNHTQPILLVVGGSMGAKSINEIIYNSLDTLTTRYQIIHICGNTLKDIKHKNYYQLKFADNIQDYLMSSDLIISRCGASASTEINALNKKALYIPLQNKASRGDQVLNAKYQEENGFALTLTEDNLNKENLVKMLEKLMSFDKKPYYYDKDNNSHIVDYIYKTAQEFSHV